MVIILNSIWKVHVAMILILYICIDSRGINLFRYTSEDTYIVPYFVTVGLMHLCNLFSLCYVLAAIANACSLESQQVVQVHLTKESQASTCQLL